MRLPAQHAAFQPFGRGQGVLGHLWEQLVLPALCRGRLLFSPGNTGPLFYSNQVVTIHDASTFDFPDAFTGLFGRWYRWLLPRLAQRVRGVITVSHFSRERLAVHLGVPLEKITVVHNGITHRSTQPAPKSLAQMRTQLNLPARFILFVGSRDPRKNLDRLMSAFAAAHLPGTELVVAGGSNAKLFREEATDARPPRVHILGHVSETVLESLYCLAEGFVFPSLYEGFGLPPLEAMARGCPVLCANSTSLPEICGPSVDAGGACLYFDPTDTGSLIAALHRFSSLSAKERDVMVSAGYRVAARYSWERCARETAAALQDFANADLKEKSKPGASFVPTQPVLAGKETHI